MPERSADALVADALSGNRRALSRLLSRVEDGGQPACDVLAQLYRHTGSAHWIGITGAPGTGKSSLVAALARAYRAQGERVAILAVDPSSPYTGGAILGDRIRMADLSGDPGIFIRSMATRGALGGLADTTRDLARVFDACGFGIVLIETVGAGQNEVAVAQVAHTVVVVEAPGLGDDVQAIKAGILETADILVVNKSDLPGAANTVRALRTTIDTGHPALKTSWRHHGQLLTAEETPAPAHAPDEPAWVPMIVQTVATAHEGIDALTGHIHAHQSFLKNSQSHGTIERARIHTELLDKLRDRLLDRLLNALPASALDDAIDRVANREADPMTAVTTLIEQSSRTAAPPRPESVL
ncbi:MAG: methylmalonyl Co-A mutase-associated GTPase MeaB [Pleurocapsa minor GSE-CHR-MK-17-07R]|jgi:LAO/AO transport system kinase|nr:methylmalonyl Co-A mutase-associated GTPase MeaB [Pleurocapsa minor GSE-CHR-MK 17-07R]